MVGSGTTKLSDAEKIIQVSEQGMKISNTINITNKTRPKYLYYDKIGDVVFYQADEKTLDDFSKLELKQLR